MDDSKVVWCMNGLCGSSISSTSDSKKGWPLRSGQFATLCINCGSAYEQLIFCDMFHLKDSGWRECTSCGKRLHCGCIASSSSLQLLDTGGVNCTHCAKKPEPVPNSNCEKLKGSANSGGSVGTSEKVNESLCIPNIKMEIYKGKDVNEASQTMVIEESSLFQRCRHLLPKPPKYCLENSDTVSPVRVARPPVEGRIKNQLLPRYWPRITDQELQQISGESNAIIVPLFEKVLSASDAGRIGRLVLPKACAEAYFPAISQPEGLPLRIQDVKGKEWIFQFRFWPNNNSRMYVLEGVTPCIHSMQLLAGDTVTFSRMDPGGKLLMGFRKASIQDTNLSSQSKTGYTSEPFFSDFSSMSGGYSGFLQSLKAGDIPLPSPIVTPERKRSRNIGSKSKRLVIDNEDALELKFSWEELQDMLRPPLTCEPSTLVIEDHEFEEYQEPPVLAKRSIFTVGISGVQEQWAQCDSCLKWRKLPADFLIPSKWTCVDNIWDDIRTSCAAPDELSPRELENLLIMNNEFKKQKCGTQESVEVDGDSGGASVAATTTKHPRHRPGCSCIVCIQPPSGKGKHKPTCTCNVCMTVKRRFKTLMMRKKKRQSDREAEIAQRNQLWAPPEESSELDNNKISISSGGRIQLQLASSAELDLNSNPNIIHDDLLTTRGTMMTLLQEANMPLQIYLKQNGLTSLVNEQQGSSGSQTHDQPNEELSQQDHSGNNSS